MRPKRIFLIRHGQSEGNVDKEKYNTIPDYAMPLTALGKLQAYHAGIELKEIIKEESISFYISAFRRTKETYNGIVESFPTNHKIIREDPRLREQEWAGVLHAEPKRGLEKERDDYGQFYYRFPGGESCADVYDRLSNFLDTLFRDFEKPNYPDNTVLVMHGMAMRVFLMRWFRLPVEEFEVLRNPRNCQIIQMYKQESGKYELTKELAKHKAPTHNYHFPL